MGDQLQAALARSTTRWSSWGIAEIYVRFVIAHKVGFDLIFATELRESDDDDLRAAGRRVIDLMMRPGIEVSPDLRRALELTEELWTTAHGYASALPDRVLRPRTRPRGRGGSADGAPTGPGGPVRTLTSVSEDSGRKYVIPDDPADRPGPDQASRAGDRGRPRRPGAAVRGQRSGHRRRDLVGDPGRGDGSGRDRADHRGPGDGRGDRVRADGGRAGGSAGHPLRRARLLRPGAGAAGDVLPGAGRCLRDRHLRAHRGGADHPAGPPLVEPRGDRGWRDLDLAGAAARAVGPGCRARVCHRWSSAARKSPPSRSRHTSFSAFTIWITCAGTKVPALRTRGHWAGRSGGGQDGI